MRVIPTATAAAPIDPERAMDEGPLLRPRPPVMASPDGHGREGKRAGREIVDDGLETGREGEWIVHPQSIADSGGV